MNNNKKDIMKKPELLPDSPGIFRLHDDDSIIYLAKTSNLRRTISRLLASKPEDEHGLKMISLTKEISWETTNSLIAALLKEKLELNTSEPQFNNMRKSYSNYVYLKIDFGKVPYFSIAENTLTDDYYIGPFFDRFFPLDVISILGQLQKYPVCENGDFPCYRFKDKSCEGWCLKESSQIAEIIVHNYITINKYLLKDLQDQRQKLFDELEFEQEVLLKDQIKILEKYYEFLKFFHTVKRSDLKFTYQEYSVQLKSGQIESIETNGEIYHFPVLQPEYRKNEFLAVEKEKLSESWILFNYLKKKYSQKYTELYLDSAQKLLKELGYQGE
ncbi:hypothetical protein ACFLYK_01500 [Candidatus Cloacimonadota bacterium]